MVWPSVMLPTSETHPYLYFLTEEPFQKPVANCYHINSRRVNNDMTWAFHFTPVPRSMTHFHDHYWYIYVCVSRTITESIELWTLSTDLFLAIELALNVCLVNLNLIGIYWRLKIYKKTHTISSSNRGREYFWSAVAKI